jgi:hypothetical protein
MDYYRPSDQSDAQFVVLLLDADRLLDHRHLRVYENRES